MNDNDMVARIEGYAAVFHQSDLNGDVLAPGAFRKSLAARKAPVRLLYQHAAETPIGRWVSFQEDHRGLLAVGELLLSSARAREVYALLAGGALDGLSIGYQVVRARKTRGGVRRILEADLWEVSIVTFPMALSARITHVGAPRAAAPHPLGVPGLSKPRTGTLVAREGVQKERAQPARSPRRTSVSPPADVRHFADALRSAARTIAV